MASRWRTVLILTLCASGQGVVAGSSNQWPRVMINDAVARAAIHTAMDDVVRWIREPRCQTVLAEFRDEAGCPLTQRLENLGVSFERYLTWVFFRDASDPKRCDNPSTFAVTKPGSRIVFMCTAAFHRLTRQEPARAKALIIHEVLHTLGLGENGRHPTSDAITRLVLARCQN